MKDRLCRCRICYLPESDYDPTCARRFFCKKRGPAIHLGWKTKKRNKRYYKCERCGYIVDLKKDEDKIIFL